jgi:hypothetical protein
MSSFTPPISLIFIITVGAIFAYGTATLTLFLSLGGPQRTAIEYRSVQSGYSLSNGLWSFELDESETARLISIVIKY